MKLDFSMLSSVYFTISNLFPVRQQAVGKQRFIMQEPRHTDALLLFSGATGVCYQEGRSPFYIPLGAVVYLPKDSRYMWEDFPASEDGTLEKLLFEFTLHPVKLAIADNEKNDISVTGNSDERIYFDDKVSIITTKHPELYKKLFSELISAFKNKENAPLDVYCVAYEIFSVLSKDCRKTALSGNVKAIEKGVRYIEQNPCSGKTIAEIADMCGVCVGYFERIFKSYAGVSPIEYINMHKILFIKMLLQDSKLTLEEIAERMNYCDSGYLCRIFKKKTGMTPGEYRKLYLTQQQKADNLFLF